MNTSPPGRLENILGKNFSSRLKKDERIRSFIEPIAVIWKSHSPKAVVENEQRLLHKTTNQIGLRTIEPCILRNDGEEAGLILDFGAELNGGVQIMAWKTGNQQNGRLRIRFGESVSECMSDITGRNATNDHSVRDMMVDISALGTMEFGNTGFRFVRIDLLDKNTFVELKAVRAVFLYRDLKYLGSFKSNDENLNKIWETGAYTVHLNMQNYLWDGVKRDRLVWVGDICPEAATIYSVFGGHPIVRESLDLIRNEYPLPMWMNGFPAYSMWWIINQHMYFMQQGDFEYLKEQKDYLDGLIRQMSDFIDESGKDITPAVRFFDWPSSEIPDALDAGVQALHIMALNAGAKLCAKLGLHKTAILCAENIEKLKKYKTGPLQNKQSTAFLVLAGMLDAKTANKNTLAVEGSRNISTFMGYFILKARIKAGDIEGCLDLIRTYWGGMLEMGATTFWEDFDIEWMKNAFRIDCLPEADKTDIHGDNGKYCYEGFRHSLCHGWASGPTAWLSEYVMGVEILEPGCEKIKISPNLGDLEWVKGTYPTPRGVINICHKRKSDGTVDSKISAPEGIEIIIG